MIIFLILINYPMIFGQIADFDLSDIRIINNQNSDTTSMDSLMIELASMDTVHLGEEYSNILSDSLSIEIINHEDTSGDVVFSFRNGLKVGTDLNSTNIRIFNITNSSLSLILCDSIYLRVGDDIDNRINVLRNYFIQYGLVETDDNNRGHIFSIPFSAIRNGERKYVDQYLTIRANVNSNLIDQIRIWDHL